MRDRHFPRVCGRCHAPMARQEDACWSCGTRWASEDRPRTALHAISEAPPAEARLQSDRWIDDGGGFKRAV
jgi:predicted amidophosphoribosyltransferase